MKNFWNKLTSWQKGMFVGVVAVVLLVLREAIVRTSGYDGLCSSWDPGFQERCSVFGHTMKGLEGLGRWIQWQSAEFLSIILFSGVVGYFVGLTNKRQ